jgi:hypothetical protein
MSKETWWIPTGTKFFVVGKDFWVTSDPVDAWQTWKGYSRDKKRIDLDVYCVTDEQCVNFVDGINNKDDESTANDFHEHFILEVQIAKLERKIAKKKAKILALQFESQ